MHKTRHISILAVLCAFVSPVFHASAAKIELNIKVVNQFEETRTREVRANLPRRVATNDIIDLNGMDLRYDVVNDMYYVYKEVELAPKSEEVFKVQIRDIWVIPEEEITALKSRTAELIQKLKGRKDEFELAGLLKTDIDASLEKILIDQAANPISPGAIALNHVTAYDANVERLKQVKKDVRRIENLVLGSGQDPGDLIESSRDIPKTIKSINIKDEDYGEAIYKIEVVNPSETQARTVSVNQVLPAEIGVNDILDRGGLAVGKDSRKGVCYVHKEGIELEPGGKEVFIVKIRDKWNINVHRIPPLRALAELLQEKVVAKGVYKSVEQKLEGILLDLKGIEEEVAPTALNDEYVAFFRDQAERLDAVEMRINRIKEALTPIDKTSKLGFKAKPPSMKSTWMIIYIILGFLAVVSLLFFLRWFGKTGSEIMEGGGDEGGA